MRDWRSSYCSLASIYAHHTLMTGMGSADPLFGSIWHKFVLLLAVHRRCCGCSFNAIAKTSQKLWNREACCVLRIWKHPSMAFNLGCSLAFPQQSSISRECYVSNLIRHRCLIPCHFQGVYHLTIPGGHASSKYFRVLRTLHSVVCPESQWTNDMSTLVFPMLIKGAMQNGYAVAHSETLGPWDVPPSS